MFSQYAERLRRTKWKDANELAEELYAILSNFNLPLSHGGPINLTQPGTGQPALNVDGSIQGDTVISFTPGPRPTRGPDTRPSKDFTIGSGNVPQLPGNSDSSTTAGQAGQLSQPPDGLAGYVQQVAPGGSSGFNPGNTGADQSQTDSGSDAAGLIAYTVNLIGGKQITAFVLQLSSTQIIPQGTGVLVTKIGKNYFIQPPVWL